MDIKLLLNDTASILGAILLLYAYFMVSTNKWNNNTRKFYIVNFLGAFFALLGIIYRFNFSVLIIETVFLILSANGYMRIANGKD